MKKSSIFILVLSILVVMFLSSFVGLSVGCDYAKNHYTTNRRITSFSMEYAEYEYGCGEADCKYCNGTKATGESLKKSDYKEVFVYYLFLKSSQNQPPLSKGGGPQRINSILALAL